MSQHESLVRAARLICKSSFTVAFTGAGISVESGIPPFRGPGGIWNKYDPKVLDLNYFHDHPSESWEVIKVIFYDFFQNISPNPAHKTLALWESNNLINSIITQNIDHLHQKAGSKIVIDFHGHAHRLVCLSCHWTTEDFQSLLKKLPPQCPKCGDTLKPDFVFFGENIPQAAYQNAFESAEKAEVFLIIGTSGEVSPANQFPIIAKQNGAVIIEINNDKSLYTNNITDIYISGKAGEILPALQHIINEIN
jgi:NAD-dependent deacetylase